ncbi:hypothetical protein CEXT_503271 [Caerostris extrusa]|uniref:Uncharacterized protein n=1 Tax=Caerostris extrusa TaxID=172846 RepID=A0AAV4P1M1_CAEEX|nr:hypothetical protein CEXT_503271 [Caerostris extrusa]
MKLHNAKRKRRVNTGVNTQTWLPIERRGKALEEGERTREKRGKTTRPHENTGSPGNSFFFKNQKYPLKSLFVSLRTIYKKRIPPILHKVVAEQKTTSDFKDDIRSRHPFLPGGMNHLEIRSFSAFPLSEMGEIPPSRNPLQVFSRRIVSWESVLLSWITMAEPFPPSSKAFPFFQ